MEAMNYVKPELIVVAFVLYFFGVALRHNTDFLKRRSLRLMDLLDNLIHIIAQPRHQNPLRDRRKNRHRPLLRRLNLTRRHHPNRTQHHADAA